MEEARKSQTAGEKKRLERKRMSEQLKELEEKKTKMIKLSLKTQNDISEEIFALKEKMKQY